MRYRSFLCDERSSLGFTLRNEYLSSAQPNGLKKTLMLNQSGLDSAQSETTEQQK